MRSEGARPSTPLQILAMCHTDDMLCDEVRLVHDRARRDLDALATAGYVVVPREAAEFFLRQTDPCPRPEICTSKRCAAFQGFRQALNEKGST